MARAAAITRAALTAALLATPAMAQTAEPSSTTATYGNWTVTCTTAPVKTCQMTSKLTLKGGDGQQRPLLEVAIGLPPGGTALRFVVQVPPDVALRDPVVISLDATANAAANVAKPQTTLMTASYVACTAAGCIADAELSAGTLAALQAAATTNISFTALAGPRKITVPVAMTGFGDAYAALGLPAP